MMKTWQLVEEQEMFWLLETGFLSRTVPPAAVTSCWRYPLYEGAKSAVKKNLNPEKSFGCCKEKATVNSAVSKQWSYYLSPVK